METNQAVLLAVVSAGVFFLFGLLSGIWKYWGMMTSDKARAPYYVDITHRASLMYAFSGILLAVFAHYSAWSEQINVFGVLISVIFYAAAIFSYFIHGVLKDTNNQMARPHKLGPLTLPSFLLHLFVWALIIAEVGGFLVLFTGTLKAFGFWF